MIIVGTHLDRLPAQKCREIKEKFKQRIVQLYRKPGYPNIEAIRMVSSVTQEGVRDLVERIYVAATNAMDHDTKERIIGMQVRRRVSGCDLKSPGSEVVCMCSDSGGVFIC